jgi:DNA polymerase-1
MDKLLNEFKELWAVDYEFIAHNGSRQVPVCLSARELRSGRRILQWQDQFGSMPPYDISDDSLIIAYYASAEMGCHRALGWPQPARILDLYTEFRNYTNGNYLANGKGLLGALIFFGLDTIGATEKDDMRDLVLRGGPWSMEERSAILDYCQSDTDALARLLPKLLPHIDIPRALYRARYSGSAVSAMEFVGVPIDTELLERLLTHWQEIMGKLIREVNSQYGVYEGLSFREHLFEDWLVKNGFGVAKTR